MRKIIDRTLSAGAYVYAGLCVALGAAGVAYLVYGMWVSR